MNQSGEGEPGRIERAIDVVSNRATLLTIAALGGAAATNSEFASAQEPANAQAAAYVQYCDKYGMQGIGGKPTAALSAGSRRMVDVSAPWNYSSICDTDSNGPDDMGDKRVKFSVYRDKPGGEKVFVPASSTATLDNNQYINEHGIHTGSLETSKLDAKVKLKNAIDPKSRYKVVAITEWISRYGKNNSIRFEGRIQKGLK